MHFVYFAEVAESGRQINVEFLLAQLRGSEFRFFN